MVMSSVENPWPATQPATSAATSIAPGSLPRRALVVISHADAALTMTLLISAPMAVRAFRDRRRSPSSHQSSAWVSSRSRTSLPAIELFRRQRLEEGAGDRRTSSHRAEPPPRRCRVDPRQPHDGRLAARDDHFVAGLRALDQLRQVGFGRVNRVDLLHPGYLS